MNNNRFNKQLYASQAKQPDKCTFWQTSDPFVYWKVYDVFMPTLKLGTAHKTSLGGEDFWDFPLRINTYITVYWIDIIVLQILAKNGIPL